MTLHMVSIFLHAQRESIHVRKSLSYAWQTVITSKYSLFVSLTCNKYLKCILNLLLFLINEELFTM